MKAKFYNPALCMSHICWGHDTNTGLISMSCATLVCMPYTNAPSKRSQWLFTHQTGKFFTTASLRKNLSLSLNIVQLDQSQCFPFFVPTTGQLLSEWGTTGHRRNKKKVRMKMYGNGGEETHFLLLQSLINRLQHSHSRTQRTVHTTSSWSSI